MCGIAGVVALRDDLAPPSLPQLAHMIGSLAHRGPDEFGIYRDRRAGLGHARLSVVDVASGQQPRSSEGGSVWIAFNGEVFNDRELKGELVALGHRFRTRSDTEVVLHAFEQWGNAAFERFNGQWAVAFWDARTETLTLARDRFGICPLYVCEHQGRVYFASEVKAIFAADASVPRELDSQGLAQTLTFWTVVPPGGVFRGVSEIEPGHVRTYAPGGVRSERCYWRPHFPCAPEEEFRGSFADAAEATGAALERATRLRMLHSDVPVGSYLSGGLDSSLLTALGRRENADAFHTFSLRFEDAEYDETPFQRVMAGRLGTQHHELVISRNAIAESFPAVIAHVERPILRSAPTPLYLLSKLVRDRGIKVVLTGEGADEMFAGYDIFREAKVRRFWARAPGSTLRPALLRRLYPYLGRSPVGQEALARQFFGQNLANWRRPDFAHGLRWQTTSALLRLLSHDRRRTAVSADVVARLIEALPTDFSRWSYLARDQFLESKTLLSGYLLSSQGDRMLMAHSVEGRFPYLDNEVVQLANQLPPSYKLRCLDEKYVLKRVAERWLPKEIIDRTKQPYRAPDALSFVSPRPAGWAAEAMSERALADAGVFDVALARRLWLKCLHRSGDAQLSNFDNMALVGVLSTQLLHDRLVRHAPERTAPTHIRTIVDKLAG